MTEFGLLLAACGLLAAQQQIDSRPQPPTFWQSAQPNPGYSSRVQRLQAQQNGQLQRIPDQSAPIPPSMEEMQRRGALRINPQGSPEMPAREQSPAQSQAAVAQQMNQAARTPQSPASQPVSTTATGAALRPANPPRISYAGGQLTVVADNSQLSDILRAVGRTTGAHLEGSAPDAERVFGQFGPGTARDVLNSLLTGSRYDFVLLGSLDTPGNVNRIVLSPHAAGAANGTAVAAAGASNQPGSRPNYNPNAPQQTVGDEENSEDNNDSSANSTETEPPPQPEQQQQPENNATQPNGQQQPNQIKTPEQLLQELQRLRQQQQQQQNQQGQQPQQNPQ